MKQTLRAVLCALLCLFLCGCSASSGEKQIFPICMSLDRLADGRLQLGVQVSSMDQAQGYAVFSAAGGSFSEALEILGASMPYPLHFGQLRLCMLGYTLATEQPLRPLLSPVAGLHTIRPDAAVTVAMGSALETMTAQQPDLGVRLSTYLDQLLARLRQERLAPQETLTDVMTLLDSGWGDPVLGLCALNPEAGGEKGGKENASGGQEGEQTQSVFRPSGSIAIGEPSPGSDLPPSLTAGALPRKGGNPVEYVGCITTGGGRLTGALTAAQTRLFLLLRQEAKVTQISPQGATIAIPRQVSQQDALELVTVLQQLGCDGLGTGAALATQYKDIVSMPARKPGELFPYMHLTITYK